MKVHKDNIIFRFSNMYITFNNMNQKGCDFMKFHYKIILFILLFPVLIAAVPFQSGKIQYLYPKDGTNWFVQAGWRS